ATLPDEIKAWDFKSPAKVHIPSLAGRDELAAQLLAFVRANPASDPKTSHHRFHFTDVPVATAVKYADGKTGRTDSDIVRMIPFCVNVLRGKQKEINDFKITKPVTVILLAHFVGDIHQPLHVGAEYFNEKGQPVDPDKFDGISFGDTGGNDL